MADHKYFSRPGPQQFGNSSAYQGNVTEVRSAQGPTEHLAVPNGRNYQRNMADLHGVPNRMARSFAAPNGVMSQGPRQYPHSAASTYSSYGASQYAPSSIGTYESNTTNDSYRMGPPYQPNMPQQSMGMNYGHHHQFNGHHTQYNPAPGMYPPPYGGRPFQPVSQPYPGPQGVMRNPQGYGYAAPPHPQGLRYQQGYSHPAPQGPQGFGNYQGYSPRLSYPPHYPAAGGNTAQGFMPVTRTFRSRNDYYESSVGPLNRQNHHHATPTVHSYAPLPYDDGPIERDFSSAPTTSEDDVHRHLVERAASEPRMSDASAFKPMKRVLLNQGIDVGEISGPPQPFGKAVGPRVPDLVNCCIHIEGLHPSTTYADLFKALRGKILRTHITPPNAKYPTAAAKIAFFFKDDALRTYHAVKRGEVHIRGVQVPIVKWNWDGMTEDEIHQNPNVESRVLIIKGPIKHMNMDVFDKLFKSKIYFDLEDKFQTPCNEVGMIRYEWRFGSIPNQSHAAKKIIEREPLLRASGIEVSYGKDPCEIV